MTEARGKGPQGSLTARLLASAALVMVSGAYAVWQPVPRNDNKPAIKLALTKPRLANNPAPAAIQPALPAAPVPQSRPEPPVARAPQENDAAPPSQPAADAVPTPPIETTASPVTTPAPLPQPLYADGDFTGEPFESDFGPIQVEVIVESGKIVTVNFLQVPDHRRRSAEISDWAIPILTQEAIQAQSPRIDIVSSATYTTMAFEDALYNALEKAKK